MPCSSAVAAPAVFEDEEQLLRAAERNNRNEAAATPAAYDLADLRCALARATSSHRAEPVQPDDKAFSARSAS